jgi:hypothetical protein
MRLNGITVRPVVRAEEQRYQRLMAKHHYLGFVRKIGETIWYVAEYDKDWVALIGFSVSALKCAERDKWIGWDHRRQYGRLKLIVNNNRFLILPDFHLPNLGSRVLSLCLKRLPGDWLRRFGHSIVLAETFVDPYRYKGTIYKAANWVCIGETRGYRRKKQGYIPSHKKLVFVKALKKNAKRILSQPILDNAYQIGEVKMLLTADQMRSLPDYFRTIEDPRRSQGRRHRLSTVLGIAAGAVLCGMRGYKDMAIWAKNLGQKARERFGCRYENGRYEVPSESIIRNVLIRVDPNRLNRAIGRWNEAYGQSDESLAIDGKTMCNAIDDEGRQTHIMSAIGHDTKRCYTQKKSV